MHHALTAGRGLATELAWTGAHLATYPLGVLRERAPAPPGFRAHRLRPAARGLLHLDVAGAGTPVLLLHGVLDNRSVFALLRRGLRRRGFHNVRTLNYPVFTRDVRATAAWLAGEIEALAEAQQGEGHDGLHVIGHSLGGLIARYYAQRLGGDSVVRTLVTLGTPHAGTRLARLAPGGVLRQLAPESDLVRELAAPAPGCRTRFVAFCGGLDEMVRPASAARVEHPDLDAHNVHVPGVGHLALPADGRVIHAIATTLAQRC